MAKHDLFISYNIGNRYVRAFNSKGVPLREGLRKLDHDLHAKFGVDLPHEMDRALKVHAVKSAVHRKLHDADALSMDNPIKATRIKRKGRGDYF